MSASQAVRHGPPPWWRRRADLLRSCWSIPGADQAQADHLFRLQARNTSVTWWIGDSILLLSALFVLLAGPPPSMAQWLWLGAVGVCSLVVIQVRRSSVGPRKGGRGASHRTLIGADFVLCLVYGTGMARLYLDSTDDVRLMIATASAASLSGTALRYARLPVAGFIRICTLSVFTCAALWLVGRWVDMLLMTSCLLFGATMTAGMLSTSRQFVESCQAEFEAERQRELLGLLLSDVEGASRDWFWECDTRHRLTHSSPRLAEVLGRPHHQIEGAALPALLGTVGQTPQATDALQQALQTARPFRELVVALQIDGHPQWWALSGRPLHDVNGQPTGWRGVGVNVTAAHEHARTLARLAQTDPLTGLTSRHGFNDYLQQRLTPPASGQPAPLAVLMLDLDRFKSINDAHGHGIGDHLLHAVGQRLRPLCAVGECLARLGGDEFVLVVPADLASSTLQARGEQVLQALRTPFRIGDLHIEVRASLGIAQTPAHAADATALLSAADMALYAAKTDGRDRVRLFDQAIGAHAQTRARMTSDLSRALELQALHLVYQPVFDSHTGEPVAAEALLRWTHPTGGQTAPLSFIPLAEETGLIVPIGAWVRHRACADAVRWPRPLRVCVNLSAVQLRSRHLVDEVRQVLARTGLPAARLEFELTETALATEGGLVTETLQGLRALGVGLALDDFGTGFSSLAYLQRFRFDRLKIDRSFVQSLADPAEETPRALVGAILGLADALGLPCTAEGVETTQQRVALTQLGCGSLQGYLLARPMPVAALADLLAQPPGAGQPARPAAPRFPVPAAASA